MCYYQQHTCFLVCLSLLPACLSVKPQWMIQVTREIQGNSWTQEFWVSSRCAQVSVCQSQSKLHSVHPPFCRGRLSLQPNLKEGALKGPQLLERGCCERGGDFFQEGVQLSHNKLKSGIFNDKKGKTFFFVITKNSNREILPKNLFTFKR